MPDQQIRMRDGKVATIPSGWDDDQIADFITTYERESAPMQPVASHTPPPTATFADQTKARLAKTYAQQDEQAKNVEELTRNPSAMASLAADVLTGGESFPLRMAAQGGAGILSGVLRATKTGENPIGPALADTATNVVPGLVGQGLRAVAPAFMRGGLRISAPLGRKFGQEPIARTATDDLIMPTGGGADKAGKMIGAEKATKTAEQAALDQQGVSFDPGDLVHTAVQKVKPRLLEEIATGESQGELPKVAQDFLAAHPQGITPTELERAQKRWNNLSDADRRGLHVGGSIGSEEQMRIDLTNAARNAQEKVAPGYLDRNRRIMNLKGVQIAAQGREDIPASGLKNIATTFGVADALASDKPKTALALVGARVLQAPRVLGATAIGMNEFGKLMMRRGVSPSAEAIRAQILRLLQEGQ